MSRASLSHRPFQSSRKAPKRKRRLLLEMLEHRRVLANVIPVTTLADELVDDEYTSLREALALAELPDETTGLPVDDTIVFHSSILDTSDKGTINLAPALQQLSYNGTDAGALTIDGDVNGDGVPDITLDAGREETVWGTRVFYAWGVSQLTLHGLVFRGGSVQHFGGNGGGVVVSTTGIGNDLVTISNSEIVDNTSSDYGGASIQANHGTVNIINSIIDGNSAEGDELDGYCGGVFVSAIHGTVNIIDSSIDANSADAYGGAYIKANYGTVTISDSSIDGNTAGDNGGANLEAAHGTVTIRNSSIDGNSAERPYVGQYGGVRLYSPYGTVTISDSSIDGNSAWYDVGGAYVYALSGTVSISNSSIDGNSSGYDKGGIYVDASGGTVEISDSSIDGNSAGVDHGGVYVLADQRSVTIINSSIDGNSAGNNYGGARVEAEDGTVTISNSSIDGNSAINNYGGARVYAFSGTVNISNSSIDGNSAGLDYGGAHIEAELETITVSDSSIDGNSAGNDYGGAYLNAFVGTVTISNSSIDGNSAGNDYGGVRVRADQGGTVTIGESSIDGNSAGNDYGGAYVDVSYGGTVTISDSSIDVNSAGNDYGGAYVDASYGGTVTISDSRIDGNSAGNDYGGAHVEAEFGTITISDSSIDHNTAGGDVGGAYLYGRSGEVNITGSNIDHNTARQYGGVRVFASGAAVQITGSSIDRNSAEESCGGLTASATSISVSASSIDHNTAGWTAGGAYVSGNHVSIIGSSVDHNSARSIGGARVYTDSGSVRISASSISDNSAELDHGGMFIWVPYSSLDFNNNTVANNSAGTGYGGMEATSYDGTGGDALVTMTNNTIVGNRAGYGYGGLRLYTFHEDAILNNNLIIGNTADNYPDLAGDVDQYDSYNNMVGDYSYGGLTDINGNIVGVDDWTEVVETDEVDELTVPLVADNGGPTRTVALIPGSDAINSGSNLHAKDADDNPLLYDQRGPGFPRIIAEIVDIGAFEYPNSPPTAVDDVAAEATVTEDDGSTDITAAILNNDSDPDDDPLTVTEITDGISTVTTDPPGAITFANGATVSLDAAGNVSFNPHGQFEWLLESASDTTSAFSYTIEDLFGETDTADVIVTVRGVNDTASISGDASGEVTEDDDPLTLSDSGKLTVVDFDAGQSFFDTTVIGAAGNVGALTIDPSGNWTYTADNTLTAIQSLAIGQQIHDTFTVTSLDGTASQEIRVTITGTNDRPDAEEDVYRVDEDTVLDETGPGVLHNDLDVDGDDLVAALVAGPSHGRLMLNEDGSFRYVPDPNYNGLDNFTYEACDPHGVCASATVSIIVNSANDSPVAADDAYIIDEDHVLDGENVLTNDSDLHDGAPSENNVPLDVQLVTDVSDGILELRPDGSFTYVPDANFNGSDSFTYEAIDSLRGISNTAAVNITVNSVLDALIDVKPGNGDDVDAINLKSKGKTPIAILSTQRDAGEPDDFDPTLIDLSLISFRINGQLITPAKLTLEDVDGDGDDDLLLHFLTKDIAQILTADSVDLVLTAEFGGAALGNDLGGSDAIKIVPNKGKK